MTRFQHRPCSQPSRPLASQLRRRKVGRRPFAADDQSASVGGSESRLGGDRGPPAGQWMSLLEQTAASCAVRERSAGA